MGVNESDLLGRWEGPAGGLPPWDQVTPCKLESAYVRAIELKRAEIEAIASRTDAPTFDNTIAALEDAGRPLNRVQVLLTTHAQTMATGEMAAAVRKLTPLAAQLEDEIAHNQRIFVRIRAVYHQRASSGLTAEQLRLVEVVHARALERGASLGESARARLAQINVSYAELFARFQQNLLVDEQQVCWIENETELRGLSASLRAQLARAAGELGRRGSWAVRNMRALVWPLLEQSEDRALRERVWRMWMTRGDHPGEHDNKPLVAQILALRGEKARIFGAPSFAHHAITNRMVSSPQAALALLESTWRRVLDATRTQIAAYQAVADEEGAEFELAPWDRLHYAQKHRRTRLNFDLDEIRPYLSLDNVLQALFWSAQRLYGVTFREITASVSRIDPRVRVFEMARAAETAGVLYFDLFARAGKGHGSYQAQWRSYENFRAPLVPISCIFSNLPAAPPAEPTLLPWEYANVLFHEFGHALHMLENRTSYPSLGSMNVAWDFVELPSLLHERWLADRELLDRFARHHQTGARLPAHLLDGLEKARQYERIFSVDLGYLGSAIVDMKLHLLADGRAADAFDVAALERDILAELEMPAVWDLTMRIPHSWHAMSSHYAASLYVYLWADVMAADAAEAFLTTANGLYDQDTARRWLDTVLSVGTRVPAEMAFRAFRGRDPDPEALFRRFGLHQNLTAMPAVKVLP
ncbi:MAG: M3 family metallopeptidase [Proteobacteria bacterium]|nr:M3 family metallopeptidase [Pseudomonadota bacterium]